MPPILEMVIYVVLGVGLMVVNKLALNNDPSLNAIGLLITGAGAGFARGTYAPPVIGGKPNA